MTVSEELPKSVVLCDTAHGYVTYISQLSAATLKKRLQNMTGFEQRRHDRRGAVRTENAGDLRSGLRRQFTRDGRQKARSGELKRRGETRAPAAGITCGAAPGAPACPTRGGRKWKTDIAGCGNGKPPEAKTPSCRSGAVLGRI